MGRVLCFVLLFAVGSTGCPGQSTLLQPRDLKKEFTFLFQALMTTHPAVERHTPPGALKQKFISLQAQLNRPMSVLAFYRVAAELTASVKCGHTRLRPTAEMNTHMSSRGKFFPLPVRFSHRAMYVSLPDQTIREVVSINGTPISEVIQVVLSRVAVDGDAGDARYDLLQRFSHYYAWFYDHTSSTFKLDLKSDNGPTELASFTAIDQAAAVQLRFPNDPATDLPISFKKQEGFGYLKIATFSSPDYAAKNVSYQNFLSTTFREIKEAALHTLVVDIRGNGGGDDQFGALICSYLSPSPFQYFRKVVEKKEGKMVTVSHPCLAQQRPSANAFRGKIYLLTDGRTFSTAADVASVFQSNKMGIVLGRETGGGYEGNTSGRSENVRLPLTGIVVNIPLWYYENDVKPPRVPHRGVLPDVEIHDTPATLRTHTDPLLDYVRKNLK